MLGRQPETYPLVDIKTKNWRLIIGPSAVKVITGLIALLFVTAATIFFGPDVGKKLLEAARGLGL
jgi:hypothetical protein